MAREENNPSEKEHEIQKTVNDFDYLTFLIKIIVMPWEAASHDLN